MRMRQVHINEFPWKSTFKPPCVQFNDLNRGWENFRGKSHLKNLLSFLLF